MAKQDFQWTTLHTETRMIHTFDKNRVIVLDKTNNQATTMVDGKTTGSFSTTGMLLETYEQILVNFAKSGVILPVSYQPQNN